MRLAAAVLLLVAVALFGCAPSGSAAFPREAPFVTRPFRPWSGERWIGNAICYGPHRDGQRPGGPSPSREELRSDLQLLAKRWHFIRLYGTVGPAETILDIIRADRLDMQVLLGVWIDAEVRRDSTGQVVAEFPSARSANRLEIETGVRLTAAYPEIVKAIAVGNETQVNWSSHRVPLEQLTGAIREVRARAPVPVTAADDFNYWVTPESRALAAEIDFIVTHSHPMWGGQTLENALSWTQAKYAAVGAMHPGATLVLGESGWATRKHNAGEQATLIKGQPGEAEQAIFFESLNAWVNRDKITSFFFEAFDENWKGGEPPDEVEKHWGLYRADRTPKPAVAGEP